MSTWASEGPDRAVRVCDRHAAGAAAAARHLGQLAVPRRTRLRAAQRPHADLHQELSAVRRAGRLRELGVIRQLRRLPGAHRTRSSSTPRCGGRSGRTSPSVRSRCGSAMRRCHGRRVRGAGRADHGLRGASRTRSRTRRCRTADLPRRLIDENVWRATRHGLDGELIDLARGQHVPGRRGHRPPAGVVRADAGRAGNRRLAAPGQRGAAPAPEASSPG